MQLSAQRVSAKISRNGLPGISFEQFEFVLLLILGAALACFLVQAYFFLPVVSDNMYPESAGVFSALHWAKGLPLYEDFRRPPYFVTSFPPLWYAAMGLASKTGLDIDAVTRFGRMLSLVSLLVIAFLGFLWNRSPGISRKSSIMAPALYLAFPILIPWAVTARPDLPALLFSFLAICIVGCGLGYKNVLLAAVCATVAFLTRHNSVAAPVAIVLWLAYQKKWKHAVSFCFVWWSIVGVALVLIQASTGGMFLLNLGGSKFGSMAVTYVRDLILRLLISPGSGFVIALVSFGVFGGLESLKQRDVRQKLVIFYFLASMFFAALGSAAAGAAVNHFLEPALALSVLAPAGLKKLKESWSRESPWPAFALVFSMVLLLPSLDMQRWAAMHNRPDDLRGIVRAVQNRTVFTDMPYIGARSSAPQFLDPASLTYASRTPGVWSGSELVRGLDQKQYEFVILSELPSEPYDPAARYPRYPHLGMDLRSAIVHNYRLCLEVDRTYIYTPTNLDKNWTDSGCVLIKNAVPHELFAGTNPTQVPSQ